MKLLNEANLVINSSDINQQNQKSKTLRKFNLCLKLLNEANLVINSSDINQKNKNQTLDKAESPRVILSIEYLTLKSKSKIIKLIKRKVRLQIQDK